jgi:CubicO group peptidase (beta-lactamase class C family)
MRSRAAWACGLLLVLMGASAAAVPAPAEEPVEALLRRRAEAFVAAMNAPGDEALAAFARDHLASRVAREGLVGRFVDTMRADVAELGAIADHTVRVLDDGALVFVYCKRARGGAWQSYQFRVLADDDHRLNLVFRSIAVEPNEPPPTPLGAPESARWLGQLQGTLQAQQPFSGVIVVRSRGKEVYSWVTGMADADAKVPMTRTTRLNMASGSKMFTAVAILQLAQAGKLSLTDPLIRYLPDFPDPDFARRATLHQLLTHSAGAGDYWDDAYEKHWGSITRLDQMLPFVLPHLGETPAGEFSYSNSGFLLLGLVVEAVSGTSYYDYVEKHVFAPAGMTATGFPIRSQGGPDLALPYLPEMQAGAVKLGTYLPAELGARGTSAGGASTTADDLLRFADALSSGVLLDRAHLELMTRGYFPFGGPDSSYGYGTIIETRRGVRSYGHGGMAPGVQFEYKIYPDLDTVLVVMSNYDTIAAHEMAGALDALIRNGAPASEVGAPGPAVSGPSSAPP